jgi:pyruvate,water dikinase
MALGAMDKGGAEFQVLGFFYHRPYICVSFMEAAALRTPGMSPDQIHEEFVGPPEKRTPPLTLSDLRPDRLPAIPRVALTFLSKTRSLASQTSECEQFINRLRDESTPETLKSWPDERLTEQVLLPGKLTWISDVHIWASTFAVVYFTFLRKLAEKWLGDADGSLAASMVTGIGTLPSADPAFGLYGLAQEVLTSREIRNHFDSISDDRRLHETLREDPAAKHFNAAFEDFLKVYGHRAVCEAELRNPCWREDPAQVLGLVRNYLSPDVTSPEEVRARQRRVSTEAASQVDRLALPKRVLLRRVLKAARRYIGLRERLKDFIVLRSDWARQVYAEICQRLLTRGLLSDRDDLYFLQSKEVGDLLRGQLEPDTAREIISRRRRDFEWSQMVHLPKILHGEARPLAPDDLTAGEQLRGMGVSPGKVEGRARVILDPRVDSHIEPGEILVAPVTDAGWTPLFINAAGLVVDIGGLLSHGSVVAREYGLPAVVGATGATKQIKTGDRIYLDGSSGVVVKLD